MELRGREMERMQAEMGRRMNKEGEGCVGVRNHLTCASHARHDVQAPLAHLRVGLNLHEQPQFVPAHAAHEHRGVRGNDVGYPHGGPSHERVPPLHILRFLNLLPEEPEMHRPLLHIDIFLLHFSDDKNVHVTAAVCALRPNDPSS